MLDLVTEQQVIEQEVEFPPAIAVSGTVINETDLPYYEAAAKAVDPLGRFIVIEMIDTNELRQPPREGTLPIRITGRWVDDKVPNLDTFWHAYDLLRDDIV